MWPQSLPPQLNDENQIPIAHFSDEFKHKEIYWQKLAATYGSERQLISGIHFNFSISEDLLRLILESKTCGETICDVRETVYFRMARNFLRYRWLYIWLYGESPLAEESLKVVSLKTGVKQPMKCGVSLSLRNSPLGYRNREELFVDYSSLNSYNRSIQKLVDEGQIDGPQELYLPIRIKFLEKDGGAPSYLEVRVVDLDPLSKSGVCMDSIYFLHLLLIYSLLKDETTELTSQELHKASINQDLVSCYGRDERTNMKCCDVAVQDRARFVLEDMENLFTEYQVTSIPEYQDAMNHAAKLVECPDMRNGMQVYNWIKEEGFMEFHLRQAKMSKKEAFAESYKFHGFEDLEMSTQLLLRAAILKGVQFEIIDRSQNFVCLKKGKLVEYVVQATKTSLDNYASVLMMENKVVTKHVLSQSGITVPKGREYSSVEVAVRDYDYFKGRPVVIKPKTTNFGLGITILKQNYDKSDFSAGVGIAFEHDKSILIKEFVSGREFRIFVINGAVVGILQRVPANVTGDGSSTISQLIDKKNQDPRRGKGYHTPLERIEKGRAEQMFLKQQDKDFNTVPASGEVVYLRENSNISTGGDSIDYTDDVDDSYKKIAVKAAEAMNVKITGLDMIIEDIRSPATASNYAIIEMNFNPAIHIHCHPFKGQNRELNHKILEALGF